MMLLTHWVVFVLPSLLSDNTALSKLFMHKVRVGSLNINGGRDGQRRAIVAEMILQKKLDIIFLQETHSDSNNETDWALWWKGHCCLSHGTNFSAGVAILFSHGLQVNVISTTEIHKGRALAVRAEIQDVSFCFVNIYAPNQGPGRVELFQTLQGFLRQCDQGECVVTGGDWNCTTDFMLDRTGEEPHLLSSTSLAQVISESGLVDVWRVKHLRGRQYTWVKVSDGRVSAARLDRVYMSQSFANRLLNSNIHPVGFTDHHLVTLKVHVSPTISTRTYWHFNIRLLQDRDFCRKFEVFWGIWRGRKGEFTSLSQWWDVGKAHIRVFCQQYTSHSTGRVRKVIENLENEIRNLENNLVSDSSSTDSERLQQRRQELRSFLHERAKGALVRSRFTSIRDMDAPTSFFFNLERSIAQTKQMVCLRLPDGTVTTDPVQMRQHAVDFYGTLFRSEDCCSDSVRELLQGLPQLGSSGRAVLDANISLGELTAAVGQMAPGRAPGLDGLPVDFYKHFWGCLGVDLLEVLQECSQTGSLPASCRHAVLSLLPKKGDLALLKNWRPVALLCTDYKLFSKVLSNRLKLFMDVLIHRDQSYCVPDRSIMDNLFLMRDLFDVCKLYNIDIGIISLDQEKAFDRVDHRFLFATLRSFGFGDGFMSLLNLLYKDTFCLLKVGGGLSCPVQVQRGIRQGCPISGLLYSLAIEPLLSRLRSRLSGLMFPGLSQRPSLVISAYADDISVFIRDQRDVALLVDSLKLYEWASSARVNWEKSEGLLVGQWADRQTPQLPGNLGWGRQGMKVLGVFLGTEEFQRKNWEGTMERVCARLSRWKWLLSQLSDRGRVLIVNNLVASALWHRLIVLSQPRGLIEEVQRATVDFFWSGQHWLRSAVLYLPVHEGGQGLVDIASRIAAFRLQTAQKLLYGFGLPWMDTACLLLRRAGRLGLDKHLFLVQAHGMDFTGLTPFYQSVLQAWQVFTFQPKAVRTPGMWVFEEPLVGNSFISSQVLSSVSLRSRLTEAGIVKLGHLMKTSIPRLAELLNIRSNRLLLRLVEEVCASLPAALRAFAEDRTLSDQWDDEYEYVFPSLAVSPAVGVWQDEDNTLRTFRTPVLGEFESLGKKAIYHASVKVLNLRSLAGVKMSRWTEVFDVGSSPRGCWRSLYKAPVDKRKGDLQWRIVHGAIATNRYLVHLNPGTGDSCPFCTYSETLHHLFTQCSRLSGVFRQLQDWFGGWGQPFSFPLFIYGPQYTVRNKHTHALINFISGLAKLCIWKTRQNCVRGQGSQDILSMVRGMLPKKRAYCFL